MGTSLPEYRPANADDYDFSWFDSTSEWSALNKSWFNWITGGDFDGNGAQDYALLMRGSQDGEPQTALVVVRATESGWTHDVLESWKASDGIGYAIYTAAPGRFSMELADEPDPEMQPLFTTSLFLTALESCGLNHYYWEKGGWKQAYVGL